MIITLRGDSLNNSRLLPHLGRHSSRPNPMHAQLLICLWDNRKSYLIAYIYKCINIQRVLLKFYYNFEEYIVSYIQKFVLKFCYSLFEIRFYYLHFQSENLYIDIKEKQSMIYLINRIILSCWLSQRSRANNLLLNQANLIIKRHLIKSCGMRSFNLFYQPSFFN